MAQEINRLKARILELGEKDDQANHTIKNEDDLARVVKELKAELQHLKKSNAIIH